MHALLNIHPVVDELGHDRMLVGRLRRDHDRQRFGARAGAGRQYVVEFSVWCLREFVVDNARCGKSVLGIGIGG